MRTLAINSPASFTTQPLSPFAMFEKVKDFRSEGAIEYYSRSYGLSKSEAEEHFVEMLKFLSLAAFNLDETITPSDQVDEMWHAMIIQTREYELLCNKLGLKIHHSTTAAPKREAYTTAMKLYRDEFGEPHPVWVSQKLPHADQSTYLNNEEDCVECGVFGWCSCHS